MSVHPANSEVVIDNHTFMEDVSRRFPVAHQNGISSHIGAYHGAAENRNAKGVIKVQKHKSIPPGSS